MGLAAMGKKLPVQLTRLELLSNREEGTEAWLLSSQGLAASACYALSAAVWTSQFARAGAWKAD